MQMANYPEVFRNLVERYDGNFTCKRHRVIVVKAEPSQSVMLLADDCLDAIQLCGNCLGERGGCPIAELYWGPVLEAKMIALAWRED